MRTVIKHTKTVQEYKELKAQMESRATEYYLRHKKAVKFWKEGDITKIWFDNDGYLCIGYESGQWWHYNDKGEWWQ